MDAISFQVSTKAKLVGVGTYDVQGTFNEVALKIYKGDQFLYGYELYYHSDGEEAVTKHRLLTAVKLEAKTSYDITVERLCGRVEVGSGRGGTALERVGISAIYFA